MAGTRSKKTTAKVANENLEPIASPNKPTKMTKQEKIEARERAKAAMLKAYSPQPKIKPESPVPPKKKVVKTVQKKVAVPVPSSTEEDNDKETTKVETPVKEVTKMETEPMDIEPTFDKTKPRQAVKKHVGFAKIVLTDLQSKNSEEVAVGLQNFRSSVGKNETAKEANLLGAGNILVRAAQKWKKSYAVQFYFCQSVASYSNASTFGKESLLQCGAIEAIVNALNEFPYDNDLQAEALRALVSMSFAVNQKKLIAAWDPFVFEYDGIAAVVRIMDILENSPPSLAQCARLLKNLLEVRSGENLEAVKDQMRKEGAQNEIFQSMQLHYKDDSLRMEGKTLIGYF